LNWRGSLQPFPGVAETLAELKRRGLRLGVVSNVIIPGRYCDMELEAEGYARFMDFKVYSSEVGYRKPSPKIYEHAIREAFGEAEVDLSRAMFVGDSPVFDVAEPARLGMKTALVTCYRGIWPSDHYEQSQPDYRIDSVNELPDLLS
jgi:putative hydrolase of the HAD superfamily